MPFGNSSDNVYTFFLNVVTDLSLHGEVIFDLYIRHLFSSCRAVVGLIIIQAQSRLPNCFGGLLLKGQCVF